MSWRCALRCRSMVVAIALVVVVGTSACGQAATRPSSPGDKPPLRKEELEQLLAPIALYPDALLTQMLMASTYPLEIVQADRWARANKGLTGDALAKELEKLSWDPSVKSMVNFPEQLSAMSEKLELTLKIGNAFIEQQADVLNTIQVLRNRAQANGNLKTNEKQKVAVQPAPAATDGAPPQVVTVVQPPPQVITIESTNPDVIYVPTYSPAYVYGGWPYPAYPPYYYYPPSYYYGAAAVSFGLGVACGVAWGYAWGHCNWGSGDIDIDVDRNINRNTNINREAARQNIQNRQVNRQDNRASRQGNRQSWQHDPAHRKGVSYRDQRTADRFGGANSSRQAAQAREQFRGRGDAAFSNSVRPSVGAGGQFRSADVGNRAAGGGIGQGRASAADGVGFYSRGGSAGLGQSAGTSRGYSGTRGGTFNGVSRGSSGARIEAQRGYSSGGSRAAPSRGGFGGARGGGGRGGGGRR